MSDAFDPYYTWLGIHPEDQPPDHYRLLGLRTFEENPDVISNAADRQMLMVRTFQSGPRAKESQQVLNQISTAKVCLLNPQQKSDYDRRLAATVGVSSDSSPAARPAPKPAARRNTAEPATVPAGPQIVVTSDPRPTIARLATPRPAWQRPVVIGSAIAAVLALIIITAVTLAVSSNKSSPPVSPPDQVSADSPADGTNIESQNFAASGRPVTDANQSAKLADDNAFTPPPEVQPAPSALDAANAAALPPADTRVADSNSPIAPPIAAPAGSTVDVEPTGKPVDLLALIDTDRDVKRGRFIRRENGLICVAGSLHIPYRLPDDYVLTAEVVRLQENDAMIVGLWIAGRPCLHLIDGFISDGTLCGLELVDDQRVPQNPTRRAGQLLTEDKPATIVYTVRQNHLTVTVDGQTVTQWDGDPNRLRWYPFFKQPKDRNLYIGSWASVYRFSKLELLPLGGGEAATPVADTSPKESTEPIERLAVPDGEKQQVVLGQVKEIFKHEYEAATTADERMALVEKLLAQSNEAGLEAAAKFVLLSEALKYAAEAVQPDRAFQAADQLGRQFDVDPLELKIKAVSDMDEAAWDADSRSRVATAAMAVSRQCLRGDQVPTAEKLSELAEDAATRSRDGQLRIEARTWHADVRQFVKQWNTAEAAKRVLTTESDDAEANTQLGKFLCLTVNDWEKGLPYLAKTDRANVRQLAELERAAPQAANDRVELADAWWEAAKSAVSDEKDAYQRRARHWYQAALPELAGLQKIKVEKRLETLADVGESLLARSEVAAKPIAPPPPQPQPPAARPVAKPRVLNQQPGQGDTNRAAARWVMSLKGDGEQQVIKSVQVSLRLPNAPRKGISVLDDIPDEDFDITSINIRNARFDDDELQVFSGVRKMTAAFLPGSPISDRGLQYFKNCPLGHLTVCGNVTDAGVKFIVDNFQIGNLELDDTQITDAGLAHLKDYVQLHLLNVRRTKVTDAGLAHLANLQRLKFLSLDETNITDEGLKHVARPKQLESLSLLRTNITVDGLRPLASLPNLKNLWLQGTFTLADIEPIRPLFPDKVTYPNLR